MTAAWIEAERSDQLRRQGQVTFLPYADDPRVLLQRPGSGRLVSHSLTQIAERLGADTAYRYRTAAQVARSRGLTGQLLVYLEPGLLGQPDVYQVQDTRSATDVNLGAQPVDRPAAHQPRLL